MRKNRILYSVNVEDIQKVAIEEFGLQLNESQLKIIGDRIGDYFNWYDTIEYIIENELQLLKVERSEI